MALVETVDIDEVEVEKSAEELLEAVMAGEVVALQVSMGMAARRLLRSQTRRRCDGDCSEGQRNGWFC
jgi:hypothetical protein